MKKAVLFLLAAILTVGAFDAQAQKKKSASKAKTTAVAAKPDGEPIKQIIEKNDLVVKDIKTLEQTDPSLIYQVISTRAFLGPALEIASQNSSYQLTANDKKALIASFNKMLDAMKPGLVKAGNSQANVNKTINDLKTTLASQINKLVILQGFYM